MDIEESRQHILDFSTALSGFIEDFPDHLYDAHFRTTTTEELTRYQSNVYNYYKSGYGYGYEPSVIQGLRLVVKKLEDMINKLKDTKGEPDLKEYLNDMYKQLKGILDSLTKKYGTSPEPSEYEKSYEDRKNKKAYYYPIKQYPQKKRTEKTLTGLSVEEQTRDEIMKVLEEGIDNPGSRTPDGILTPEMWNYTLQKLREKYLEYKKKNSTIALSKDEEPKNLLDIIRLKGKLPKKED